MNDKPVTDAAIDPPVIAGDHADDDAAYIDDLLTTNYGGMTADEIPREDRELLPAAPALGYNRLITVSGTYDKTADAVLALPADPRRKSLSFLTDTQAHFADNPAFLNGEMSMAGQSRQNIWTELEGYTGPLYFRGYKLGGPTQYTFTVVAVTR